MFEMAAIFAGSFTLALSGALMPGPLFTITISESVRRGCSAGPLLMVGHALLEMILVAAVILGLGAYLKLAPVMAGIAVLGGLLLIYLGIDMLRSAGGLSLAAPAAHATDGQYTRHLVVLGILSSLSNPYWTLWWATIGLGYLVAAMKFGALGVMVFFLGHISADFAWYTLLSFGVSRGRMLLEDQSYQWLIKSCGVLLVGFGGWFLFSARNYLAQSLF